MDDKKRSLLSQLFGDEPKKVPKERKPSKRSKRDEERPVREPKVKPERQAMKVRSRGVQTMTKLVDF
jgi:hypothetical protein